VTRDQRKRSRLRASCPAADQRYDPKSRIPREGALRVEASEDVRDEEPIAVDEVNVSAAGLTDAAVSAIVDAAPDGIILADPAGKILLANRQTEVLFGYQRGDLFGHSVDDLLPAHLRQVHRAHRTRYRAEPRTRAMGTGLNLLGRRSDGSVFPVEISLSPLATDGGLRVVAVIRDVSARIEAEAEAREVREILERTRDGVFIFDADTLRFTYVNEGAREQVGYGSDELLQMTMLHIAPEFTEEKLKTLLQPLQLGDASSTTYITVHRHRDGTDVPVEIVLQAVQGDEGRPRRYVEIVRDIRERLETEERLRRAEQDLRVVEDRERIARDLHDIVIQKLFAAGMTIQGVWSRTTDTDQARRLSSVVDDLDDTIREIRSAIFSLQSNRGEGVRGEILRIVSEERLVLGFEPRVRFDGPVDTISGSIAAELLATLREALSNVARHAAASAVEIIVECGDSVRLRVLDDGRGIPVTRQGGNGILNLTERATMLGGQCRVAARPDAGTTFEWEVPNSA
jgi:two-component system sensor histidine kinase DevS